MNKINSLLQKLEHGRTRERRVGGNAVNILFFYEILKANIEIPALLFSQQ